MKGRGKGMGRWVEMSEVRGDWADVFGLEGFSGI